MDAIVDQWHEQRPDLDPSAKHVTGRIIRLAGLFQHAYGEAFAPLALNDGDYGVLVALRRSGAPFELTPTELARHRMMTSGGMTAMLDRLERKGLIVRAPNPADRRGSLVRLSEEGLAMIDEAMVLHTEAEHALVAALGPEDQKRLTNLLRRLLLSVET